MKLGAFGPSCASVALALLVQLGASRARADVPSLELAYDAPPECPSADALRDALGKLVTEQRSAPYAVRVSIALEAGKYLARIAPNDGSERTLSGATCAEVVEATSVVLALAINPKQPEAPPPAAPPSPEPPLSPPPDPKPIPRPTPRVTPPPRPFAGAALVGDLGTLPRAGLGAAAHAGVELGPWSASAQGTYLFVQRKRFASDPSKGGDFSLWSLAARGCGAPYDGAARFGLCAGAELGRISGSGVGSADDRDTGGLWTALLAGPELALPIVPALRAHFSLDAVVPIVGRHPFTLDGNRVHQPNPLSFRAAFGLEVVF